MNIHVITIFPELFQPALASGVVGRALSNGLVTVNIHNLREHTDDLRKTVDDSPYGGGHGMIMLAEPIFRASEAIPRQPNSPIILLSPKGATFRQADAERLSLEKTIILICGRYDGVDERVSTHLVSEEISVGDYVLSGGEFAALVMIDAIVRLQDGVLGHGLDAIIDDTYTSGILQYPHYTRPRHFRGLDTPEVLLSGDHSAISHWRRRESLRQTFLRRPDLLISADIDDKDKLYLESLGWDPDHVAF
jgi:tRNA (guanine37-N1)-methyltransferase